MQVQIVGAGVVGRATGLGLMKLGHQVTFHDTNKKVLADLQAVGKFTSPRLMFQADFHFICVPEQAVPSVLSLLLETPDVGGTIAVRSTVPPRTCESFDHVSYNPELLREATALPDFMTPPYVLIGECCKQHGDKLEELYRPLQVRIVRTSCRVAEAVKLSTNGYLHTILSYWNLIHKLCEALQINSVEVGMIASLDQRVSDYGARLHGHRIGGSCLPKDVDQLIELCKRQSVDASFLTACREINEMLPKI